MDEKNYILYNNYDGSRMFLWLAELCGLPIDLMNFILCQVSALFLSSLFRSILHPNKVSVSIRHATALGIGLFFGYFCYGVQAIHIAGLPTICYVIIRTQSPQVVQRYVMLVAMIYLLCIHLARQIYFDGFDILDVSGPLMIITQKVTSLAFNIHDGFVKSKLEHKIVEHNHRLHKMPSMLEYFSYVFHFHGLMAGPLVFYNDYIEFIEGSNYLKKFNISELDTAHSQVVLEPSPMKPVIKKVIASLFCAFIYIRFINMYPLKAIKDDDFIKNSTFIYKWWYITIVTTCVRFKYYHAWLLADAICNNSGLGFSGYDKDGNAKWDLVTNINVVRFEFATNLRNAINNWNCGTNIWLRSTVYDRVPGRYGTIITFTLSALWHGFYPGYYLTFITAALLVTAARVARHLFRHRFQRTQFRRVLYDIITCLITRFVMSYITFPFCLLEFTGSIKLYLKLCLCLHIAALIMIFILPRFIKCDNKTLLVKSMNISIKKTSSIIKNNGIDSNSENTKLLYPSNEVTNKYVKSLNPIKLDILVTNENINEYGDNTIANQVNNNVRFMKDDKSEMDQISSKILEKLEAETKNIEEFIDKTVTDTVSGIVEFKNDLMRDCEFPNHCPGICKRNVKASTTIVNDTSLINLSPGKISIEDTNTAFLKKEIDAINAVVQQANVLPAVLSNGHVK